MPRQRVSPHHPSYEVLYGRVLGEEMPVLDFPTADEAKRFARGWYSFMSRRRRLWPSTTVNVGIQSMFQGKQLRLVVTHTSRPHPQI